MNLTIDFWQLLLALFAFLAAVGGMVWGVLRLLLAQYEKHQDERYNLLSGQLEGVRHLEQQFNQWQLVVSERFVHREDYIRGQTLLEAKLDAIGVRQQLAEVRDAQQAKERER